LKFNNPSINDVAVTETFYNLSMTYNFFKNVFGRNSIDNKGIRLDAVIHFGDKYNNAFWNGTLFVLGDGDGQIFRRFTKDIDVLASEYTKGIIQYETHLGYSGQAGSLIQHFADVFGSLVKQYDLNQSVQSADWIIGSGLFIPKINGVGLFSLKAPGTAYNDPLLGGKDPQVSHFKDYNKIDYDDGGIHLFSGIPNHAFYVAATEMRGYAWNTAGRIWYDSLTRDLGPESTFEDLANVTFKVAGDHYGIGSEEQKAVKKGWDSVGIKVL
jgi:Zn-dependent metalloprotease